MTCPQNLYETLASSPRLGALSVTDHGFMFDPRSGVSYSLNRTGRRVLGMMRDGQPLSQVTGALTREFRVSEDTARIQVEAFVRELSRYLA